MAKSLVRALMILTILGSFTGFAHSTQPFKVISEQLVAEIDFLSLIPECIRASQDCQYLAFGQRLGSRAFVKNGNHKDKVYAGIAKGSVIFSPDGSRLAYTALVSDGGWLNVIDGSEGNIYSSVGKVVFSPDGRHNAYMAERNGRKFIVKDGKEESGRYDAIIAGTPVFSPDGTRMVYAAVLNGKHFAVIDGKEGPKYDNVCCLIFSPDGKRLAYLAAIGSHGNYRQFAVVDGNKGKSYQGISSPMFSPDGFHFTFVAIDEGQQFLVVDGIERKRYYGVKSPVYSSDSSKLAYVAVPQRGKRQFVVLDGKPQDDLATIKEIEQLGLSLIADDSLTFSPDGKRLAYIAGHEGAWSVVVDGVVVGKEYDGIWDPVFSPDSKHIGYVVRFGIYGFPVVDGTEIPQYSMLYAPGSRIVFDSTNMFHFLAVNGTRVVIVRMGII